MLDKGITSETSFDEIKTYEAFPLTQNYISGLKNCFWPGRAQILQRNNIKYYIDGAHTPVSIHECLLWFQSEILNKEELRILCFNCKSTKDYIALLTCIQEHASKLPFDYIFFTPSKISTYEQRKDKSNILSYNNSSNAGPIEEQLKYKEFYENTLNLKSEKDTILQVFSYVDETLERIEEIASQKSNNINVLVTGSLYVVGAFLECLEFNTDYNS